MNNRQCTDTILMIRPAHFGYNPQTAGNNAFQSNQTELSADEIQRKALQEFDEFVSQLKEAGIKIMLVQDNNEPAKPDAVFPNNWITTHRNGAILTYPMQSKIRRKERREDIIEDLMDLYGFDRRYSLEQYESKELYLEGTGSMILDRTNKVVYACISVRTDPTILDKFCALTGYSRVVFTARDLAGQLIYHTNVMMCLGEGFATICLDAIVNEDERKMVRTQLEAVGNRLVEITQEQMASFAGNMLQITGSFNRQYIVMSSQAYKSLTESQKDDLSEFGTILHSPLDTIEYFGGGSARCMIAEIFTPVPDGDF